MHNKNIKKFITNIIVIIFFIFYAQISVFASAVPQFNPKEQNPKPGLYKLNDMHYESDSLSITPFNNNFILYDINLSSKNGIEIFDTETFKFKKLPKIENYLMKNKQKISFIKQCDENNVALFVYNLPEMQILSSLIIYNLSTDKFKVIPLNISGKFYKAYLDNNFVYMFFNKIYNNKVISFLYIYDRENGTISEKYDYNSKKYLDSEKFFISKQKNDNPIIDRFKSVQNAVKFYNEKKETGKKIIVSRSEVDYGISVKSVLPNEQYHESWFSPLYQYDFGEKKLIQLDEYIRSIYPTLIKIPNKNMVLILGGRTSIYPIYRDAAPKDVPLIKRINGPTIESKQAYVYVYNNEKK